MVSPAITCLSRSGSRLTVLIAELSSNVTIITSGKANGPAAMLSIIVSSPVLIAPSSGPMLPVTSITNASAGLSTLKSAVFVPLAPTGTLSRSLGSVSAAQSDSLAGVKNSCAKSASTRVYIERWSRNGASPASGSTTIS